MRRREDWGERTFFFFFWKKKIVLLVDARPPNLFPLSSAPLLEITAEFFTYGEREKTEREHTDTKTTTKLIR